MSQPTPLRPLSFPAVSVLHAVASGVPYGFQIIDEYRPDQRHRLHLARPPRARRLRPVPLGRRRAAHQEKRPPRRYYAITASGERVLDESMSRYRALRPVPRPSPDFIPRRCEASDGFPTPAPANLAPRCCAPGSSSCHRSSRPPRGGEWLAEWHAEVAWHLADGAPRQRQPWRRDGWPLAGARALGALPHATWTRKEEWTLDMLLQDLRYAARQLTGRPAFPLLAVLTLSPSASAPTPRSSASCTASS